VLLATDGSRQAHAALAFAAAVPGAVEAAEKLLAYQPDVYHTHKPWLEDFTPTGNDFPIRTE
jgi:hypothetical protein